MARINIGTKRDLRPLTNALIKAGAEEDSLVRRSNELEMSGLSQDRAEEVLAALNWETYGWTVLRHERDKRLRDCDWTALPDAKPAGGRTVWIHYRQELRDLPANTTDPFKPNWPIKPGGG